MEDSELVVKKTHNRKTSLTGLENSFSMQAKIREEEESDSYNRSDSLSIPNRSQENRLHNQNFEFNKEETPETTARLISII